MSSQEHFRPLILTVGILIATVQMVAAGDDPLQVVKVTVKDSEVRLRYLAEEGYYYILDRGDSVELIAEAIDLTRNAEGELVDREGIKRAQSYYRVRKVAIADSLDIDGDGIKDVDELNHPGIVDPLESGDADLDFDNDGETNKEELNKASGPTDPGDAVFKDVEFTTADEFTIAASLGSPRTLSPKVPAIIFIHQGGSTRREWQSVAKLAFRQGWVTLAYDIRGHGDSSGRWTSAWFDDPDNAPEDLKAAIDYVKGLSGVDTERIAVIGSSVGGNLACVASALYGVKTAVAISHKTSAVFNLSGEDTLEFRSIYHLSSEGDQGGQRKRWATELFEQTADPKKLEIVKGSSHGVAMFRSDRTVPDRIIQWLKDTL